jgi:predicted amidohydrolase
MTSSQSLRALDAHQTSHQTSTGALTLGVVQLALEEELELNREKIVRLIHEAAARGCRAVVFPEGALWSPGETRTAQIDAAITDICAAARSAGVYVVTGLIYKLTDAAPPEQRLLVVDPTGQIIHCYDKIWGNPLSNDVPRTFQIDGIRCGAVICADRWARGIEELPAMDGAQLLIECSANWLREWIADLDHFWCAPRARRTGAYVVFANSTKNPRGARPGHGHTAVIAPDGKTVIAAGDDHDRLLVTTLDFSLATLAAATERRTHPLFERFWQTGVTLMNGGSVEVLDEGHTPLTSPEVPLKIAAAQMACSRALNENVARAVELIRAAGDERADVVVFPELTLTGALDEDVLAADGAWLAAALGRIQDAARTAGTYVAIGLPWIEDGARHNCVVVVGPDGSVLTRYAQLVVDRPQLFAPGTSTRAMWVEIKGIPTVITIGGDALWSELAELAAVRGAQVHLHLSYDRDVSAGASQRRRQLWANLANFRTFTVTVNAASPEGLARPSAPAQGGSILWEDYRREPHATARRAGHGPWSAYRLAEAAEGETLLWATQVPHPVNQHFALMTDTRNPQMRPWYAVGALAMYSDISDAMHAGPHTTSLREPALVGAAS